MLGFHLSDFAMFLFEDVNNGIFNRFDYSIKIEWFLRNMIVCTASVEKNRHLYGAKKNLMKGKVQWSFCNSTFIPHDYQDHVAVVRL